MKKIHWELLLSILFVVLATFFVYGRLANFYVFWSSQLFWSVLLAIGWVVVSIGYFNQGWIVHQSKSAEHVSVVLPVAVFIV